LQTEVPQNVTITPDHSKHSSLLDVLVFVIPCAQFIQIKLIGVLSGSDILLLICASYLVVRGHIKISEPIGKWFIALCTAWLGAQCITDIVRHSPMIDYARGWSNIAMTLVNFSVLWTMLHGHVKRIAIYGWGLVIGSLLTYFIVPDDFMVDYPWKFGLALPVTLGVFLFVSRTRWQNGWPNLAIVAIGLVNIYLGSRNRGAVCLACALYVAVAHSLGRNGVRSVKLRPRTVGVIGALVVLGAIGIFAAYQYAAKSGILGAKASEEYARQSSGQYGLLIGGRTEMLASIPAIYDSPILGHGSWAKDPSYLIAERQALALMGYDDAAEISIEDLEEGLIPSHSYLFGAWVSAGIVGALFWAWVLIRILRALMCLYPRSVVLLPLMTFAAFSMLWDIVFSPYGATARIIVPYYIVTIATCIAMMPGKVAESGL